MLSWNDLNTCWNVNIACVTSKKIFTTFNWYFLTAWVKKNCECVALVPESNKLFSRNSSWCSLYQLESKTLLHMFEFSWCRGNSEPETISLLCFRSWELFPEDTCSYLVRYSLKEKKKNKELEIDSSFRSNWWIFFLNILTVPDWEGSFVHLHAHQKRVFWELYSGDEVQRSLSFEADLHACP